MRCFSGDDSLVPGLAAAGCSAEPLAGFPGIGAGLDAASEDSGAGAGLIGGALEPGGEPGVAIVSSYGVGFPAFNRWGWRQHIG